MELEDTVNKMANVESKPANVESDIADIERNIVNIESNIANSYVRDRVAQAVGLSPRVSMSDGRRLLEDAENSVLEHIQRAVFHQ
ncbi:MAG: hypothetical protein ABIM59_04960, partial [candidate division WOR-3 bacterium]